MVDRYAFTLAVFEPGRHVIGDFDLPYVDLQGNYVDPAADIAAFLIGDGPKEEYPLPQPSKKDVEELARLHLAGKALTSDAFDEFWKSRKFPIAKNDIKGDEIELVYGGDGKPSDEEWVDLTLNYIGRRSISRYGCYGCHDINGSSNRHQPSGLGTEGHQPAGS